LQVFVDGETRTRTGDTTIFSHYVLPSGGPKSLRELRAFSACDWSHIWGSVRETRAVSRWAGGTREPSAEVQNRLRVALQIAVTIAASETPRIAQAWFQGLNPQLDDRSPARLLREGDIDEVGPAAITAAHAFLIGECSRMPGGRPDTRRHSQVRGRGGRCDSGCGSGSSAAA